MSAAFDRLEARVSQLLALSKQLRAENSALHADTKELKQKNEQARVKVDAIIEKLKKMDIDSND